MTDLSVELDRLAKNETTFDTFASRTRYDWERLAGSLLSRWSAPIEVDDLRQAMLEAAWQLLPKWDPTKGSLRRFIVFNAVQHAKREIHRARGASLHGSADFSKSRLLVGVLPDVSFAPSEDAVQDRVAEARERISQLKKKCRTERDLRMLEALVETGSLDAAVVVIYAEGLSADDVSSARLSIQRVAKRLTKESVNT